MPSRHSFELHLHDLTPIICSYWPLQCTPNKTLCKQLITYLEFKVGCLSWTGKHCLRLATCILTKSISVHVVSPNGFFYLYHNRPTSQVMKNVEIIYEKWSKLSRSTRQFPYICSKTGLLPLYLVGPMLDQQLFLYIFPPKCCHKYR